MSNSKFNMENAAVLALESVLLADSKWIVDALKKVKEQRNCLEIERLQLESMLRAAKGESSDSTQPHTSTSQLPSQSQSAESDAGLSSKDIDAMTLDSTRINEQLHLTVSEYLQNCAPMGDLDLMEEEEDEDDFENVNIDIGMLMNENNEDSRN